MLVGATSGCTSDTPLTFDTTTLPDARVGEPYQAQITVRNPAGSLSDLPFTSTGTLPPGLTLYNYASGTPGGLRGTPTTSGTYSFTVSSGGYCTMAGCNRGKQDYTLTVAP